MTTQDPSRRRFLQASGATLTAIGTAGLASTSAAAQSDTDGDRSLSEKITALIAGFRGEVDSHYQRAFGELSDAETNALAARDEFNANSEKWVTYINDHASLSGSTQVVSLEFVPAPEDNPDDTHTVYLITDHDGQQYTSAELVEQTDREVDEQVLLESIAAENAAEEIDIAYDEFVEPDESPSDEHLAYLGGKYRFGSQHVTTTILGDDF